MCVKLKYDCVLSPIDVLILTEFIHRLIDSDVCVLSSTVLKFEDLFREYCLFITAKLAAMSFFDPLIQDNLVRDHWFWLRGSRKPSRLPLCPWRCHLKKTAIGHWGGMDPDCMKSWNFEFESLWVDKEMHIFIWGFISSGSGTWISSNLSHSGHKNRQLQEMKINKNNCCRKDRNDFS